MTRTTPINDILKALAKARRPLSVAELVEVTGWGRTTIRDTLRFLRVYYVDPRVRLHIGTTPPCRFGLAPAGLDLARRCKLTKRTKLTKLEMGE